MLGWYAPATKQASNIHVRLNTSLGPEATGFGPYQTQCLGLTGVVRPNN